MNAIMVALAAAWTFIKGRGGAFVLGAILSALALSWWSHRGFDDVRIGSSNTVVRNLPPTSTERGATLEPSAECPELPVLKLEPRREAALRERIGRPLEPEPVISRQVDPGATPSGQAGSPIDPGAIAPQGEASREFLFDRRVPPADFGGAVTGSWLAGRPVDVDFVAARPLFFFPGRVFAGARGGGGQFDGGDFEIRDAHVRADLLWIKGRALVGAEVAKDLRAGADEKPLYLVTVDFCLLRCPGR